MAIHLLPQVLNAGGVLSNQERGEPIHHLRHGLIQLEHAALADAVESTVGFDTHKRPDPVEPCLGSGRRAAVHRVNVGDSHVADSRKLAPQPSAWSADYWDPLRTGAAINGMSIVSGRTNRRKKCPSPADPIMKSGL